MFGYSFAAMTAYNLLQPVTRSAFITDLGADNIPYALLAAGVLIGFVMQFYSWLIGRLKQHWAIPIVLVGLTGLLLTFWVLLSGNAGWVSAAFYLFGQVLGTLLLSQFWTVANDIYDPRQARRLFGFIGGGASRALVALKETRKDISDRWVPTIEKMIGADSPEVRAAAIATLASIRNEDAAALARTLINNHDPRIAATAAVALAASNDEADRKAAEGTLTSLAADTRETANLIRRDLAAASRSPGGADAGTPALRVGRCRRAISDRGRGSSGPPRRRYDAAARGGGAGNPPSGARRTRRGHGPPHRRPRDRGAHRPWV